MSRDDLIAAISKASAPKPVSIEVDGMGTVYLRVMTAYDAEALRKQMEAAKKDDGCETGRLLAGLLCDEDGKLLFDIDNAEQVLMLAKLPSTMQTAMINAGSKANDAGK